MVKFGVNFSRGVKNRGCLFPKMVLFKGPRPSKSMKRLSNLFPRPSKSPKSAAFSGTQTLLRETNPRVWGGQSTPRIGFSLLKCQDRLRMSCKKWRLPILFLQSKPSISSILSVFDYQCCADFAHVMDFVFFVSPISALQYQQSCRFCRPPWISSSPLPQFRLRDRQSHRCHCTGLKPGPSRGKFMGTPSQWQL